MSWSRLETRIPPLVVLALCMALAWLLARVVPAQPLDWPFRGAIVLLLAAVGVGLSLASKLAFGRAATTVNPMRPKT